MKSNPNTTDGSPQTARGNLAGRWAFVTRPMPEGVPFRDGFQGAMGRFWPGVRTALGAMVVAALLVAIGQSGGCVDQAAMRHQIESARQDLGALRDDLAARERALRQALEDPSAPADLADGWRAQLVVVRDQLAAAEHAIGASADYEHDPAGGAVARTIGAVAPFVPEPYRLPLVLGAGLAASLARGAQLRRAGRAIARGVQRALDADPQLAAGFAAHAGVVRDEQPPLARRLVDEAQGKRAPLPI